MTISENGQMVRRKTLVRAVVGSTAYGLNRDGSDVDELGIFISPTLQIAGLFWSGKKETKVKTEPDLTLHEVGKFLRLALKGNPTILELFWVPKYEKCTYDGARIMALDKAVLSHKAVRDAYLGYAVSQARRLEQRGDSFSADTRKRTAKHGRHMLRLLRQSQQLALSAELDLVIPENQRQLYWDFDDMTPEQMLSVYEREKSLAEQAFENSVLPEHPNVQQVDRVLRDVRKDNL